MIGYHFAFVDYLLILIEKTSLTESLKAYFIIVIYTLASLLHVLIPTFNGMKFLAHSILPC